ncbi:hypothetical protein M2437_003177 [Methylorubrum pseudosasae]|nr:hypothetical protein [Methylorubrum pseudosasae]
MERLCGVLRPHRGVSEFAQGLLGEGPDVEVVLNDEDAGAVAFGERLRFRDRPRCIGDISRDAGEVESEGRALAELALDNNLAASLLGEPKHLAQPEPRALSDHLGREEGLEDPL